MKKILIVDDKEEVRELIWVTLEMSEHQLFMAENGEDALKLARQERPDLLFLDVQMPGALDGLDVCKVLKDDPETRDIHIVMLTAKGQMADREAGFSAGANDYFVKPFSPLALIKKVDEVLDA